MTRKPRRHALSVPVRSGSEVGFPQSLGEVHDMLYDKSLERDNCGFGLIAHIEGEPSHKVVRTAIHALARMQHRGAILADGKTGDGCGLLLQKPDRFFRIVAQERGWRLAKNYAVGMLFLNKDPELAAAARRIVEEELQRETLSIVGWRDVPTNEGVLGEIALSSLPRIEQIFVNAPAGWRPRDMERRLFIARRRIEKRLEADKDFYVCSLSNLVNIYKGLCMPADLPRFYLDLADLRLESAICLFHQRFSTNTVPRWPLAQPFRYLAHNGEINTITGNRQWARARTYKFQTPLIPDLHDAAPFVNETGSDSSSMDNMLELLLAGGMDIIRAMRLLVPPAWQNNPDMDPELRAFFDFNSMHMEPWDGPAGIVMSDGRFAACNLDRNGLRPARYVITKDKLITCASEVGIWDYQPDEVVEKGRVGPGELMVIDTRSGRILHSAETDDDLKSRHPYKEWMEKNVRRLVPFEDLPDEEVGSRELDDDTLASYQKQFNYSAEELDSVIRVLGENGQEAVGSMGDDTPFAVLSSQPRIIYDYFRQQFAQVTNPPIDSIREEVVTSTTVYIGSAGNLLEEKPENCKVLRINNPILTNTDLMKIRNMKVDGFKVETIPIIYYKNTSLEKAVDRLFIEADRAYRDGANILILSDRGVDDNHVAIPSLLAVSALQQYLVKTKKRTSLSLILESGEPREVHHFATLLGFGASAINPYLALDTVKQLIDEHMLDKDYYAAVDDYNHAIITGIVKIAAKMGISTIQSYQGSKIFEALGIDKDVIDKYFTNTVSRIGGISIKDIENDVNTLHSAAYDPLGLETDVTLDSKGRHKMRSGADAHLYNPATIHLLQQSTKRGDYEMFKQYTSLVDEEEKHTNLRGLMDFEYPKKGVKLEEVESVDSIVTRFKTGAMSYGSISKEAHETLAIAMNHLHGKSNTGEGGEDKDRLIVGPDGKNRCSAIKQVASGRFGVTSRYLTSAQEIQIKMAQGAKPGEGGHLPGKKVYPWIAKTRLSTPGVSLISPPPHHDIYSIEDLEQLIFDLKNANRDARISVKLVSEAGVGTVAAGVAKAGAQVVLISGYDGGTGAAPSSSIHNAGLPWELGLAETHQTLIMNGLRNKVRIETDGKLMSGKDVAIAACLGAEEFGFATAPLVTMGCVMMRVCNLDTCPAGIATQNPELRKRFAGKPEYVENFMRFIAEELREYMAKLGVRTVDELVGRSDFLKVRGDLSEREAKLDLSNILNNPFAGTKQKVIFDPKQVYDFELDKTKDITEFLKQLKPALDKKQKRMIDTEVTNVNRSLGTIFGSEITKKYDDTLDEDTFIIKCSGAGGQSFGAFIPKGLTLELVGDSNDYFGKGLSGGKLIVYPPAGVNFKKDENIIIGNVALYGATSGKAFINGVAGERFCVRNSGATAVVEGVGDHGCEYMTGGRVVILGKTGKNFAAGMSGGIAYVLDEDNDLYMRTNKSMVFSEEVTNKYDVLELKEMIKEHVTLTNSEKGKEILDHFSEYLPKFKKVIPYDYNRMQMAIVQMEEKGLNAEQAQIEAFYASTRG